MALEKGEEKTGKKYGRKVGGVDRRWGVPQLKKKGPPWVGGRNEKKQSREVKKNKQGQQNSNLSNPGKAVHKAKK